MDSTGLRARLASVERHVRATVRADAREGLAEGAALVLAAHVVRAVAGLAGGALVARALGAGQLGAYVVTGAAVSIGATLANFGLGTSATRQIASELALEPEKAFRSAAAYARLRLLSGLAVLLPALVLARPLAALLGLPRHDGPWLIRLAGATVLAVSAAGVVSTIHYSRRRFRPLLAGQVAASLATLAGIAALFELDRLSIVAAVAVGIAGQTASLGVMLALLPPEWRRALVRGGGLRSEESRRIRAFAGWLGVAGVLWGVEAQLDLILVSKLLEPRTVGLYGLAFTLALKADALNQIVYTTLLPTVSGLSSRAALADYGRRSLVRSTLLAAPLVIALPFAGIFIRTVYGREYQPATPIFYALMAVVFFDLFAGPLLLLAFPLNLPRRMAASNAVAVAALAAVAGALIPLFGVYGAVTGKLVGRAGGALVIGSAIALHLGARRQGVRITFREPDPAGTP
jgi:O-antigen/teichoic acid export membrane protein